MEQFEIKSLDGRLGFITVVEQFKHHYTGETIRVIRLEYIVQGTNEATVEGPTYFTQVEYDELVKYKVNTDHIA